MSVYHPIFDDEERVWDLPSDLDVPHWEEYWNAKITLFHTKKGWVMLMKKSTHYYFSTRICFPQLDEPLLESAELAFWDTYIVPYIIPPPMIDMTGEFDGDDIELAQIIMDEIEEGRI